MELTITTGWYAVHTRSNFETRVAEDLRSKGIEEFVPTYEEVHHWKDRKKQVKVPLFPGYLFVRLQDCPVSRTRVTRTTGVVSILGHGGMLEPVPEPEIAAVRRILESRTRCSGHPLLQEGKPVRVIRGTLTGLEGLLVKIKNNTRLVISVGLLSRSVAAEMDSRDVEPIPMAGQRCIRT